jgi:LmbE family N-acetylglucosaminyl deacetylase
VTGRVVPVGDLPARAPVTLDAAVPASALAVGAHPDDIEFGCGATLAKWAAAGCLVSHLVLTDGAKGTWDPGADPAALILSRQAEQRRAAERLGGGDVHFLGYPDGELQSDLDARRRVCEVIRRVRPAVVLGHDPWRRYRLHPDHRHAGWLVVDGVVAARDPAFYPEQGLAAHRPSMLLLWEADEPNHVESAGATELETKLAALLEHRSQYRSTMGIGGIDGIGDDAAGGFAERIRTQLAAHGALAGVEMGEAFRRIDDL